MSLAVDVYHSQRHIKTFIEGLLIDDEHERVRYKTQVRTRYSRIIRATHGCTIASRHCEKLNRACLARLFDERILIAFIQLETLNGTCICL